MQPINIGVWCSFSCISQIRNYTECACVQSRQVITPPTVGQRSQLRVVIVKTYLNENGYAVSGKCDRTCNTLIPFLVFLFIVTLITACAQPSAIIVTLRWEVSESLTITCCSQSMSVSSSVIGKVTFKCLALRSSSYWHPFYRCIWRQEGNEKYSGNGLTVWEFTEQFVWEKSLRYWHDVLFNLTTVLQHVSYKCFL